MASSELVTLKGGIVVDWSIVQRLLDLEARGAAFTLEDGGRFRVVPPAMLTGDDVAFLRLHRDAIRQVLAYSEAMAAAPC
jgi:hypothetical protein